ncbi:unnamed protein product [Arabidopsis halleri]
MLSGYLDIRPVYKFWSLKICWVGLYLTQIIHRIFYI